MQPLFITSGSPHWSRVSKMENLIFVYFNGLYMYTLVIYNFFSDSI